jgi:hypothetical protein
VRFKFEAWMGGSQNEYRSRPRIAWISADKSSLMATVPSIRIKAEWNEFVSTI